jgi:GT2 family glycosyltransferase
VLSIILVNYKRADDTIECIQSLQRSTFTDFETIVVDNASGDGSVAAIRSSCPAVQFFESPTNVGFAEGNNIGIRQALAHQSNFILLLNNDTVVEPNALSELLATFRRHPGAGIVGPKIYYHDRPNMLWYAGGYFNPHSSFGGHYGIGEDDNGAHDSERTCALITGCCMMFRREVCDRIGLLDADYFAYLEDADSCTRAERNGFSLHYQAKAIIYHKVSSTSAWDSPVYIYFNLRNKILFLKKNALLLQWLPHLPRLTYYYVRQFIRLSLKWRSASKTRAAWYGFVDGLRNNIGEFGKGRLDHI